MRTAVIILLLLVAVPASAQLTCDPVCLDTRERLSRERETGRDRLADQQRESRERALIVDERRRDRAVDVTNEVIRSRPFIDPAPSDRRYASALRLCR